MRVSAPDHFPRPSLHPQQAISSRRCSPWLCKGFRQSPTPATPQEAPLLQPTCQCRWMDWVVPRRQNPTCDRRRPHQRWSTCTLWSATRHSPRPVAISDLYQRYSNERHLVHPTRSVADECLVYRETSTQQQCQLLQKNLDELAAWSITWGMAFNVSKCNIVSITNAIKNRQIFIYNHRWLEQAANKCHCGSRVSRRLQETTLSTSIDVQSPCKYVNIVFKLPWSEVVVLVPSTRTKLR